MSRTEFIAVTALILLAAFALGWFAHWLVRRVAQVPGGKMDEIDHLGQMLHEAEEMKNQAALILETREKELTSRLSQSEAELAAAMEGLRNARHEAEEMRRYIERMQGGARS